MNFDFASPRSNWASCILFASFSIVGINVSVNIRARIIDGENFKLRRKSSISSGVVVVKNTWRDNNMIRIRVVKSDAKYNPSKDNTRSNIHVLAG